MSARQPDSGTTLPLDTTVAVPATTEIASLAVPEGGYWSSHAPALDAGGYLLTPLITGTKRPAGKDWVNTNYNTDRALLRGFRGCDVGVKTGVLNADGHAVVAFDIDCDDQQVVEQHVARCEENIGTPLRRDGRRGTMLLFRTSKPRRKATSRAYMAPGHEKRQRLEVLGVGQQAAVYVEHPDNGQPYYHYPNGEPTDMPLEELPEISEQQIFDAVDYFDSLAEAAGWAVIPSTAGRAGGGERKAGANQRAPLWKLEAMLAALPPEHADNYDSWIKVGVALHCATGGSARGLQLFDEWSQQSDKYDGDTDVKWKTFASDRPDRAGAGTLAHMANGASPGWLRRAEAARDITLPGWRERERAEEAEKLRRVAERIRLVGGGEDEGTDTYPDPPPLSSVPLDVVALSTFQGSTAPPRQWIVEDLIPGRTVADLSGDGGTGKSLLSLQLAVAMATGRRWLGRTVTEARVLYVSCEDELTEVRRRVEAIVASEAGLSLADLTELHVLDLTAAADTELAITGPDRQSLQLTDLFHQLAAKVAELKPKLVIIDTRADVFGGNEISRVQVRAFVRHLKQLCVDHDLAVLLLSHPSVTGMSSGSGQSGSTAWGNSVRSRLYLAHSPEGNDPDLRTLKSKKANYGAADAEITLRWHAGVFELAGGVVEGKPLDREQQERRVEARFIELLREFDASGRYVNHAGGPYYAPKEFAAADPTIGRSHFKGAMARLFSQGRIKVEPLGSPSRNTKKIVEVAS